MKRKFAVWLLCLLALPVGLPEAAGSRFSLKQVYKYPDNVWSWAMLGPQNEYLYLIEEPRDGQIKIIDWRNDKVIQMVDLLHLPCSLMGNPISGHISGVVFPAGAEFVYVQFCDSLYRMNWRTWASQKLVMESKTKYTVGFARSGNGGWIAFVRSENEDNPNWTLYLIEETTLKISNTWQVPDFDLKFTPDGKHLAVMYSFNNPWLSPDKFCRIHLYEIPAGDLIHSVDFSVKEASCPSSTFQFLPQKPNLIAGEDFSSGGIAFWDIRIGQLVRKIADERPIRDVAFSPDGRWMFGSVWRKRDPLQQDFKIWDVSTGKVVYESARQTGVGSLGVSKKKQFAAGGSFSHDGQYLVVAASDGVTIYRLEVD